MKFIECINSKWMEDTEVIDLYFKEWAVKKYANYLRQANASALLWVD